MPSGTAMAIPNRHLVLGEPVATQLCRQTPPRREPLSLDAFA